MTLSVPLYPIQNSTWHISVWSFLMETDHLRPWQIMRHKVVIWSMGLTAKSQATLLPNMGTCSRAIWDQQASLPIRAITGVWRKIMKWLSLPSGWLKYTGPSLYHGPIQHDFGHNTVKCWTPKGSADIRNSSTFAHIRKYWIYINILTKIFSLVEKIRHDKRSWH